MALEAEYQLRDHAACVPSDVTTFTKPFSAVFVGGAGTVTIRSLKGTLASFTCPAGIMLPVAGDRVMSTGTTATLMVLIFGGP